MSQTEITIDGHLGLSEQAMAVLAMLSGREHYFEDVPDAEAIWIRTSAWYNGREKGVCLRVHNHTASTGECLIITFAECRASDNIFVDCWLSDRSNINPPTHNDLTDAAYERRRDFEYGQVGKAAQYILKLMEEFLAGRVQETEEGEMVPCSADPRTWKKGSRSRG